MCYITRLPHPPPWYYNCILYILFLISGKIPTSKSAIGGGDIETKQRLQGPHRILIHVKPRHGGVDFVSNNLSTIQGN